ncbi:MAG: endonuclease/exonuclease/phosphatase family protein [Flavobacteriales bacterium]|nr:endonuclease/exonuclease/phosphatase family protein [Flavobacteriales bacterium]MCL4281483.1 endonuclease/exonuclease/phosphatase family protein [Flavobacteriales bacterium]
MGTEGPGGKARKVSRWHRPIWWLNGLAVLSLLVAYLSTRVDPSTWWPLALVGMAYPYLLLANLLCIAWWLLFRRKRMLPSLVAILLGWGHLGNYVQFSGTHEPPGPVRTPFTLMSWNVRLFDLYNWTHNQQTRDEIMELIRVEDPDILCMQEFLNVEPGNPLMVKDTLLSDYRFTHCADAYTVRSRGGHYIGIAIFSTWPILARGSIQFPDELNNLCLWADIAVGQDTIRVYTAHLASLRFGDVDYAFMRDLGPGKGDSSFSAAGGRILGRLKDAFIRRSAEVDKMVAHMRKSPWPVVYCGDLNDTPMSFSYHELRRAGLSDAFVEGGKGLGRTYIGDVPSFRIDHILHGPQFRSWGFRTLPDELGDHRAIISSMGLAGE